MASEHRVVITKRTAVYYDFNEKCASRCSEKNSPAPITAADSDGKNQNQQKYKRGHFNQLPTHVIFSS